MNPTKNDLSEKTRVGISKLLNEVLAALIDLQLQAKQAHWNVKGARFMMLHELFDSIAETMGEFVDDVAERIVALGGTAEGTLAAVQSRTSLPTYTLGLKSGRDHTEALSTAIAATAKLARASIVAADELGDVDAADLLTGLSRELDKKLWFVEAHLQSE